MTDLSLTPPSLTKAAIAKAGEDFALAILDDGNVDILTAYMRLRATKMAIEAALDTMLIDASDEAELYPPADRERLGVRFKTGGGYELWDYSHDGEWKAIKAKEKELAALRKKREGFLKGMESRMVNPNTGEFIEPAAVKGFAKRSLALTFPKE